MAQIKHGIYVEQNATSITAPVVAESAIQVAVGTAPVNLGDMKNVNKPVATYSFDECKERLGYSDDFENYTLCEVMDLSYRVFGVSPVVFINVLDPTKHKTEKQDVEVVATELKIVLPDEGVILSSVVLKSAGEVLVLDTDYTIAFDSNNLAVITLNAQKETLTANYSILNPDLVEEKDILAGIELVRSVYPTLTVTPCILLAPKWSQNVAVGKAMIAKTQKLNGMFNCMAYLDVDTTEVSDYQQVATWKSKNYVDKNAYVLWPMQAIGEKIYHLSSVAGALTASTDAANGNNPATSPSNKLSNATAAVLKDGTEIVLDLDQANLLNSNGVTTLININGFRLWGNYTAIYPVNTDVKDAFLSVKRMFDWQGNTFALTFFQKVDNLMNRRLIDSVIDTENIRLNALQAQGYLAGASISYREDMNPATELLSGNIKFLQKYTPFPPAQSITNVLEYDVDMLTQALASE